MPVREYCVIDHGGKRILARVATRNGFHRFMADGKPYVVAVNEELEPVQIEDAEALVESEAFGWRLRLAHLAGASRYGGLRLRWFRIQGRGAYELPMALYHKGGGALVDALFRRLVDDDEDGPPVLDEDQVKMVGSEGVFAHQQALAIVQEAQRVGRDPELVLRLAATALAVQQHGSVTQWNDEMILEHMQPRPQVASDLVAVAVGTGYVVWNFAAAAPGLVTAWGSDPRMQSFTILGIAVALLVVWGLRRWTGRRSP